MGLLAIKGMKFYAYHGYYKEEQKIGGNYLVDVYLNFNFTKASAFDKIEDTINYEEIYELVEQVMNRPSKLVENVAFNILEEIISLYSYLEYIKVRVSKLNPPLKGYADKAYVEIERKIAK